MAKVIPLPVDSGECEQPIPNPRARVEADTGPMNVGLELCRARQRAGKTLMDVSNETKIAAHHLMAMERNRFDALPGRVYAVGFVRNYAACVGIDSQALIARLKADIPEPDAALLLAQAPLPKRQETEPETSGKAVSEERALSLLSPRERKWPQAATAAVLGVAGLVYAVSFVLFYREQMEQPSVRSVPPQIMAEAASIEKPLATPVPSIAAPPEPAAAQPEPAPPSTTETASQAPSAISPAPIEVIEVRPLAPPIPIVPAPAAVAEPVPVAQTVAEVTRELVPTPPPVVRPKPALPKPVEPKVRLAALASKAVEGNHGPLPLGRLYGRQNKDARIILRVHRAIHLAVSGPGSVTIFNRLLDAGDTYRVPNISGLKLTASDAGAVEIILDDTTVGFASKDGAAARGLPLDPQSIVDRQNHG